MKRTIRLLTAISMSTIFLSSIILGTVFSLNNPNITIDLYPSDMLSYPGQTAWIVTEISSNDAIECEVSPSKEISFEYETWTLESSTQFLEIFLYPTEIHLDSEIDVKVTVKTDTGRSFSESMKIKIVNWTTSLPLEIIEMRDHFMQYFEENSTFSDLNSSTPWEFCGSPAQILIVEHYLFKSEFWEMELSRHVMIPPYDWIQVYLRPRNHATPIWSAKIDSWSLNNNSIYEIEPPTEIFR